MEARHESGSSDLLSGLVARLGLEGQHAGIDGKLSPLGNDAVEQRAVAAMHAVEIANGERGALQTLRGVVPAVEYVHATPVFSRPRVRRARTSAGSGWAETRLPAENVSHASRGQVGVSVRTAIR